ncbi:hypothetical protein AAG906_018368 [Vitis piasezkii]
MNSVWEAIGYHVQWSTHLMIFGQVYIKYFALLVSLVLKDGNTIECPRQGVVECRYFVMRYMKEIINDPTLIISKVCA